jgi:hypothetical protein
MVSRQTCRGGATGAGFVRDAEVSRGHDPARYGTREGGFEVHAFVRYVLASALLLCSGVGIPLVPTPACNYPAFGPRRGSAELCRTTLLPRHQLTSYTAMLSRSSAPIWQATAITWRGLCIPQRRHLTPLPVMPSLPSVMLTSPRHAEPVEACARMPHVVVIQCHGVGLPLHASTGSA